VHLRAHWWWFTLLGALLVICGTAAIIFPHLTVITTFAVAALLGVMLMIGGVATIIGAFWAVYLLDYNALTPQQLLSQYGLDWSNAADRAILGVEKLYDRGRRRSRDGHAADLIYSRAMPSRSASLLILGLALAGAIGAPARYLLDGYLLELRRDRGPHRHLWRSVGCAISAAVSYRERTDGRG
jgi:hypothetical protein